MVHNQRNTAKNMTELPTQAKKYAKIVLPETGFGGFLTTADSLLDAVIDDDAPPGNVLGVNSCHL